MVCTRLCRPKTLLIQEKDTDALEKANDPKHPMDPRSPPGCAIPQDSARGRKHPSFAEKEPTPGATAILLRKSSRVVEPTVTKHLTPAPLGPAYLLNF